MAGQKRPLVCVDLALERLTAIQVEGGVVMRWFVRPVSPEAVRNGDPADPSGLGSLLRECMAELGFTARSARLSISDEALFVRTLELPRVPRRHLAGAVRYAAERELPFPIGSACYDWCVVQGSRAATRVMLFAAWQDVIERIAEVARGAGLVPEVIEPRSVAVSRALHSKRVMVLEGGGLRAQLLVLQEDQAPYTEQVSVSPDGKGWREALQQMLDRTRAPHAGGERVALLPVVLAGELEGSGLRLPMATIEAAQALNGRPPARPDGLPAGKLLANIGLAMG